MFLVAYGADVIIDKKVGSGFKECERMKAFKPWIRKMQRNAEKPRCKFCRCEIKAHRSDLNSHYACNKHQRYAVSHYIMRQHGGLLYFGFQKSSDSSNQLFRFAFVNAVVLYIAKAADTCYMIFT